MPPIVLVITDGILAILVMNINFESFKRVKGARYVKNVFRSAGNKEDDKEDNFKIFFFF